MKIITRFAPSPTGYLHIGSIRTAFYSWLFAKKNNGIFILRIEDTDNYRSKKKFFYEIINILKWLNIDWDKIIFQSSRYNIYEKIINYMLKINVAYKCFCTKKRLNKLRNYQIKNKLKPKYDNYCRYKKYNNLNNKNYVIRFKNPNFGKVTFKDLVYGNITFNNNELDDLIIKRSNGTYTYNFCSVIDDYYFNITHIIRGEDHINNTPRQINILKSLNAPIPKYIHLPIILDNNKKKLSKKNKSTNILELKKEGILSISILNYISKLGLIYNEEIFLKNKLIKKFNFNNINKSPSIFDKKKLIWINKKIINNFKNKFIEINLLNYINQNNINISNLKINLIDLIKLYKKRSNTLKDILENSKYLYKNFDLLNIDKKYKILNFKNYILLNIIKYNFENIDPWNTNNIDIKLIYISKKSNLHIYYIYMLLRILITGIDKTPSINIIIYIIGKIYLLNKIKNFINKYLYKKEIINKLLK